MPNSYTPVPTTLPATITEPVGGELRNVATVTQMTRPLADAIVRIQPPLTVRVPCGKATLWADDVLTINPTWFPIKDSNTQLGPVGLYSTIVDTGAGQAIVYGLAIDEYLIDGSTLVNAVLHFRPVGGHTALPGAQPVLAIVRSPVATGYAPAPVSLISTGSGWVGSPGHSTVLLYEVDSTINFVCNQNNVIDRKTYSYWAFMRDEGSNGFALAGCRFAAIDLNFTF